METEVHSVALEPLSGVSKHAVSSLTACVRGNLSGQPYAPSVKVPRPASFQLVSVDLLLQLRVCLRVQSHFKFHSISFNPLWSSQLSPQTTLFAPNGACRWVSKGISVAWGWSLYAHICIVSCRLVNRLQQICSALGDGIGSEDILLWNKLPTIVVVGGQVRLMSRDLVSPLC